jgi:hypothetical protein
MAHSGEVVRITHQPRFTPQEDYWYLFLLEADSTPGIIVLGILGQLKKSSDLIGAAEMPDACD